jgi:hypothetical protein
VDAMEAADTKATIVQIMQILSERVKG